MSGPPVVSMMNPFGMQYPSYSFARTPSMPTFTAPYITRYPQHSVRPLHAGYPLQPIAQPFLPRAVGPAAFLPRPRPYALPTRQVNRSEGAVTHTAAAAPTKPKVHFMRHAESTYNAAYEATGGAEPYLFDSALSELGEDQARQAAASFDGLNVDCVVVSPLRRAVHTALLALPRPGDKVPWEIWPELREFLEASADLGSERSELSELFPGLPWETLPEGVWWFEPDDEDIAGAAKTAAERVAASRAFF